MLEPEAFDDGGPLAPLPPSRARKWLTIAILLTLVVAMVFLAYTSGRGVVNVPPDDPPRATSEPTTPAPGSRLAIVDVDGRLTTTDAEGGSITAFGAADDAFAFPAWSPDGSRIAVVGRAGGEAVVSVFALEATAGSTEAVTLYRSDDRPPFYLAWSPDGAWITFLTTEPDGIALRIAPADGSAVAEPIHAGAPLYWAWADSGRLLIHSGLAEAAFFGEVDLDGTAIGGAEVDVAGFRVPGVSAGGRFRGYVAPGVGTPQEVVVEARDGTSRQSVGVFGAAAIDFSPVGDALAFIAPDRAAREVTLPVGPLRLIDGPSGEVRTILSGPVVAFFWSPDGGTIAALQLVVPGDDNIASAGDGLPTRAAVPVRRGAAAAAETGLDLRLVFVDVATKAIHAQRVVRVADTFAVQVLPYFDQYALSHRLWSADGRALVLPLVADDGSSRIAVIPADGTDPRSIAPGVAAFWSP